MKKLLIWTLALLLLVGCTRSGGRPAEQTADKGTQTEIEPVKPAALGDGRFSRTEIIRRNESLTGQFQAAQAWVEEYAAAVWPGSEVSVSFSGGYAAPAALFTDHLSGGVTLWDVAVSQTGAAPLTTQVQILYFQDAEKLWLSGVLAGEETLPERPAVYDYLRLDPRFAARMRDLPEVTPPVGLLGSWDLSDLAGTEEARGVVLLSRSCALVHNLGYGASKAAVRVVDLGTGAVLHEYAPAGVSDWSAAAVADGTATFTGYDAAGGRVAVLTASAAGIDLRTLYPEAAFRWPMGENRFVESAENSLWRIDVDPASGAETRTLLLEGVNTADDRAAAFRFRSALSADQFLYDYYGYEWFNRSGVYDLAAGTDEYVTVTVSENGKSRRAECGILRADADTLLAAVHDYGFYAFTLYDRAARTQRALALGHEDAAHRAQQAAVSPDGTRLLLESEPENGGATAFELFDLRGTALWSWTLDPAIASEVACGVTDDAVWISFFSQITGTYQLYLAAA